MTREILIGFLVATCGLACGGGDQSRQFVGNWTYTQGSAVMVTCPGQTAMSLSLAGGTVMLSRVDDNSLVGSDPSGCILRYDVQGAVATLRPNQSCTPPGGGGTQAFASGTLTMSADGHTLVVADSGSLTANGTTTVCTASLAGQLTRD